MTSDNFSSLITGHISLFFNKFAVLSLQFAVKPFTDILKV